MATNGNQRFQMAGDRRRLRARQGPAVDPDHAAARPPEALFHGTAEKHLPAIRSRGLRRGRRHHVHLCGDPESAARVGRRHGEPVILEVLAGRMHADGFVFFHTGNGVWLTEHVPPEYLAIR